MSLSFTWTSRTETSLTISVPGANSVSSGVSIWNTRLAGLFGGRVVVMISVLTAVAAAMVADPVLASTNRCWFAWSGMIDRRISLAALTISCGISPRLTRVLMIDSTPLTMLVTKLKDAFISFVIPLRNALTAATTLSIAAFMPSIMLSTEPIAFDTAE